MTRAFRGAALFLGVATIGVIARPTGAQILAGPLQNFIFTGCDTGWSCMRLVVTTPLDRLDPNGFNVTFRWNAFFYTPGDLHRILVLSYPGYPDDFVGPNSTGFSKLGTVADAYSEWRGIGWEPTRASYSAFYTDDVGEHAFDGEERGLQLQLTQTTVTPEPASMLLLATGLFGMGATAMRRRRS